MPHRIAHGIQRKLLRALVNSTPPPHAPAIRLSQIARHRVKLLFHHQAARRWQQCFHAVGCREEQELAGMVPPPFFFAGLGEWSPPPPSGNRRLPVDTSSPRERGEHQRPRSARTGAASRALRAWPDSSPRNRGSRARAPPRTGQAARARSQNELRGDRMARRQGVPFFNKVQLRR